MTITIHPDGLLENMTLGASDSETDWMTENFDAVLPLVVASLEEDGYTVAVSDEETATMDSATFCEEIEGDAGEYAAACNALEAATSDRWVEVA